MAKQKTLPEMEEELKKLQEQLTQANEKLTLAESEKEEAVKASISLQEQLTQANEKLSSLEAEIEASKSNATTDLKTNSITSSVLTKAQVASNMNVGLIKVKIEYPEGYEKEKHFKNGEEKFVAKETADHFVKLGIATII